MSDTPPDPLSVNPWLGLGGLELDDLLDEVRSRADTVRQSQERMAALLEAVVALSSDLELADVLGRIVSSACSLVDARYGALGVLTPQGEDLAEFITLGVSEEERAAIGDPPHGNGILGLLIRDPRPRRVRDIGAHPESSGFPPNHPAMRSFLGTPIRIREEVFGNLYLADKMGAEEFTADDEGILVALAAAAGVAIENARLFEAGRRHATWSEAISDLTHALLEREDEERAVRLMIEYAAELAGVSFAAVALYDDSGALVVRQAVGQGAHAATGGAPRHTGRPDWLEGLAGSVLEGDLWASVRMGRQPVLFSAPDPQGSSQAMLRSITALADETGGAPVGPGAVIPLTPGGDDLGVMLVLWDGSTGAEPVSAMSELTDFAQHAGLALLAGRSQRDRSRMALLDDRERIARDMHDHVIQRLFATGLSLQTAAQAAPTPGVRERLDGAVDDLDAVIREIRMAIFELHTPDPDGRPEDGLRRLVAAFARGFGFHPELEISGRFDDLDPALRSDVLAVVRESLSNALRHARADHVSVEVVVGDDVSVDVVDDGIGLDPQLARSGLINLRDRAAVRGGDFEMVPSAPTGTKVRWSAPRTP